MNYLKLFYKIDTDKGKKTDVKCFNGGGNNRGNRGNREVCIRDFHNEI